MSASNSKRLVSIVLVAATLAIFSYVVATFWAYQDVLHNLEIPEYSGPDAAPQELQADPQSVATTDNLAYWPNLFGPTHDSVVHDPIHTEWPDEGPPLVWEIECGEGYSSPIVWADKMVFMHRIGDEELIECRTATAGELIWAHRYPTSFECKSHYTNGPYSTPATDGELLFTIGAQGQLYCLTLENGDVVWQRDLKQEYELPERIFGVGHSPLIWGDKLILNVGGTQPGTGIIALSKFTGDLIWSSTDQGASYATPQPARIHGTDYLFVLTQEGCVSLNPETGEEYWSLPFQVSVPDAENAVTPVVYGDMLLISAHGTGTACLRILKDGSYEEIWRDKRNLTSQYTPMLCIDGYVYGVHTGDFSLRCIELTSGKIQWRERTELKRATDVVAGNRIILFGEFGHLAAIEPAPEECRFTSMTAESLFAGNHCFSAPAVSEGLIFLRDEERVACYDLRIP